MSYTLDYSTWVPLSPEETFKFFSDAHNLELITPSFLSFSVREDEIDIKKDTLINYRIKWLLFPMRWRTVISVWNPPREFVDEALLSPYKRWHHSHTFIPENGGTRIRDFVEYEMPFGFIGALVHKLIIRRQLEAIFQFRQKKIAELMGD